MTESVHLFPCQNCLKDNWKEEFGFALCRNCGCEADTFCPQCGPGVCVDEEKTCQRCGCYACGEGAEAAWEMRRELERYKKVIKDLNLEEFVKGRKND